MNYQDTLNLPKTDFSMKANLALQEPELLKRWEEEKLYTAIRQKSKGKKPFILHDGPPYANGHIHIGHALNKILKDMIVKYKTMQGFDSEYVPGWDCHGLPIEHNLFKELKTDKSKVDVVDFRAKAHEYAMKFVGIQREEFKRLGVFGDWENPYLTLAPDYEYWILKSFATLRQKGYIYHGLKPVNWCYTCETALAEAEVEYEDHTSPSVYVKFKVNNSQGFHSSMEGKNVFLLVWTTTPWTLLANVAVAVHSEFDYVAVETNGEILLIEKSLSSTVLAKTKIKGKVWKEFKGRALTSLVYQHPFGLKENCKVIAVDYVTKEDGTGLVHTAPGHGQDDYRAGVANNLEILMPVDDRGIYTELAGEYKGWHVAKANEKIIEDLKAKGTLLLSENITHSYPHCWRCKQPIIFRATEQWFLKIDHEDLRGKLKSVIENSVQWIPSTGKERILGMVTTRPDWCLSRQRFWGVPIPALVCKGCKGQHKLFPEVIEHFAEIVKTQGSDAWFKKDLKELLPKGFVCPDCKKNDFEKTKDILDVWFDSGVSHQAVFKSLLKRSLPADMYLEGSDQHRGWFQSSIIPAMAIEGRPPYRAVLTHGFVVDGQGRKMSKSRGNVIAPQDIIKTSGAEIVRLWVAASSYNEDIRISKEILDRLVDAYRKIRNTFRFILGNLDGFVPDEHNVAYEQMSEIDRWALYRLSLVHEEVTRGYDEYDFAKVYKAIYLFCNEDLSSIYLDILKDRLYTFCAFSPARRSAQTVLYYLVDHLVRFIAPILSFTAEEIFSLMPKDVSAKKVKSAHLLEWPVVAADWKNRQPENDLQLLLKLRPHVLKALEEKRRAGSIGSGLEAKVVFHSASERDLKYLTKYKHFLPTFLIASQVDVREKDQIENPIGEEFSKTEISVEPAEGQKCSRCWNYSPFVGKFSDHPTLCDRCLSSVKEIVNAR